MIRNFVSPDRIGGFFAIFLGCISIWESIKLYSYSTKILTGDHTFPGIMGALLAIVGGILLFEKNKEKDKKIVLPRGRTAFIMISSLGAVMIYCVLIGFIGYFFSTMMIFVVLFKIIGDYRLYFSVLLALIFTTVLHVLFIVLLKTPFPSF